MISVKCLIILFQLQTSFRTSCMYINMRANQWWLGSMAQLWQQATAGLEMEPAIKGSRISNLASVGQQPRCSGCQNRNTIPEHFITAMVSSQSSHDTPQTSVPAAVTTAVATSNPTVRVVPVSTIQANMATQILQSVLQYARQMSQLL